LAYVHLDDNDGENDLHWPLLSGRMTEQMLADALGALRRAGYGGALAFEYRADNAHPIEALRRGKELVERLLRT